MVQIFVLNLIFVKSYQYYKSFFFYSKPRLFPMEFIYGTETFILILLYKFPLLVNILPCTVSLLLLLLQLTFPKNPDGFT